MLSFSVVINTFNRAKSLACTLASLRQLDYPLFEVIVVNGPSTDRTDAVLSQYEGQVKILSCAERNLAISRNLGIAAAAGQIVAFIDDDAYPDPAWLDCLSVAFKDDEVAAAGGPTYDYTGYKLQAKYSLATRTGGAWVSAADDRNPTDLLDRPYSNVFPYTIGTNSCFRRARLVEIGGFDEEFEYYLDETDLCLRLIDRGYLVRALDDGFVYHKFLESHMRTHTRSLRDRFSVLKNRVYFALKHGRVTTSFYHVCCDLVAFIDQQRKDFLWNVEHGFL
ncbi:MAG TPA: glycosyltransferase, partial [Rhizomicrobium sp.]|nr:glycosyltransferase [Rhizomicrobium sp.]